ncbi:hypothetical protein Vadar_022541 [Vaccinium darrowii]|uniref:Uncharacterized protein n=1 Tax=Vaccinium darrowii TaxID=229202 RepID=A0ACB7XSH3_9ERIC|nr:hypothetical protein Vadar_022541 [Vaccinium darrowii]
MVSIKKKTTELATLCGIKVCTIVFGPHGEIDTWPEKPADVRNVVDMYKDMSRRTLKTEAGTETDNAHNMDEKVVEILNLEREIADAKRENWRKIVRLMEAMNRVLSDRTEFLKAVDERQGEAEGDVIAGDERLMEEKKADSLGKNNIVGEEPIVVNSEILLGYRNLFGSILMDMLLNVGGKSNCLSKSEEC